MSSGPAGQAHNIRAIMDVNANKMGKLGVKYRIAASLVGAVAGICLVSGETRSGTTTYDMSSVLFQQHPFATAALLPPVVARPVPAAQIRAPARMPQPAVSERKPATAPPMLAANPPPRQGGNGIKDIISEIRLGALVHDEGPFSRNEEDGFDLNLEVLFVSPKFLHIVWAPRPHLGANINSGSDTSQVYMGLSWEWSFWGNWFAGFSFGGSVHDGKLETLQTDRKELGCRLLFRESIDVGYRFGGRHGVSGFLDHISNANLCDRNEGLENYGIRYGYKF
jgi:lipid A 3-O-deacylase